jgi:sulfate permease, SulP family
MRMRGGRTTLGATFFTVLPTYADRIGAVDGRVYVSGLDPALVSQARKTGAVAGGGRVSLYEASPAIGESSLQAFHDAQAWVSAKRPGTTA